MKNRATLEKLNTKTEENPNPQKAQEEKTQRQKKRYLRPEIDDCSCCPQWQLDRIQNVYIRDGYRINYNTYSDLLASVWDLHNETCNIWTHILGALFFIWIIYCDSLNFYDPVKVKNALVVANIEAQGDGSTQDYFIERIPMILEETITNLGSSSDIATDVWASLTQRKQLLISDHPMLAEFTDFYNLIKFDTILLKDLDLTPFFFFLVCPIICFAFSSLMHTFWVKNKRISSIFLKMDYSGIATLIFGSVASGIYYAVPCVASRFYHVYIIGAMSIVVLVMINFDGFDRTPKKVKAGVFIGLTCCSLFPIFHWVFLTNYYPDWVLPFWPHFKYFLIEIVVYLASVFFYISKIPERYMKGDAHIFVCSHAIFHIITVVGAYMHYIALKDMILKNAVHRCPVA